MRRVACLLPLLLLGCVEMPPPQAPLPFRVVSTANELVWVSDPDGLDNAREWRRYASKTLRDPFVFLCHGNDWVMGWSAFPNDGRRSIGNMNALAQCLRDVIPPERDILIVCCNPHGHTLHVVGRGVYYAKQNVWCRPGFGFGGAGLMSDFVEALPPPAFIFVPSTQPTTKPTTKPTTVPSTRPTK